MTIKVSLPYYRTPETVRRAVESILNQTYRDLLVVVVNDGDGPGCWEPLEGIDDPRLVRFDLPGYRLNLDNGRLVYADRYVRTPSPFLSLLEEKPLGVYQDQHTRIHRRFPWVVLGPRSWIQVIHGQNKQMRWDGGRPVDPQEKRRVMDSVPFCVVGIR